MKQIFHKIASFLMALVVLFSTVSFTVDMHYCGDTLVDTAIFKKAKSCGMKMEKPSTEGCSISKKSCCDDKQLVIDGQDELKTSFDQFSLDQQVFITSLTYSYLNLFKGFDEAKASFSESPPPPLVRQIFKLDESYLI